MKITRSILRRLLQEKVEEWFNSDDFDFQAAGLGGQDFLSDPSFSSIRVLWIFDQRDEEYNLSDEQLLQLVANDERYQYGVPQGQTHGLDSHALKHYVEYDPPGMKQMCTEIINFLGTRFPLKIIAADRTGTDDAGNATGISAPYFIMNGNNPIVNYRKDLIFEPLNEVVEASNQIYPGDIINTLDRIQDTILEDGASSLSTIEMEIYSSFFIPISMQYDTLRKALQDGAKQDPRNDVSDKNWQGLGGKPALLEFLKGNPKITFKGIHGGAVKTYFYDLEDSSMSSIPSTTTATLYRYYKPGSENLNSLCGKLKWLAPTNIQNYQQMTSAQKDMGSVAGTKGAGTEIHYHGGYTYFWEIAAECYFGLNQSRWQEEEKRAQEKEAKKQEQARKLAAQKAAMAGQSVDLSSPQYANRVKGQANSDKYTTDKIAAGIASASGGTCTPQQVYDYLVSVGHRKANSIKGTHAGGAGSGAITITEAKIRKLIRKIVRKNIFN